MRSSLLLGFVAGVLLLVSCSSIELIPTPESPVKAFYTSMAGGRQTFEEIMIVGEAKNPDEWLVLFTQRHLYDPSGPWNKSLNVPKKRVRFVMGPNSFGMGADKGPQDSLEMHGRNP